MDLADAVAALLSRLQPLVRRAVESYYLDATCPTIADVAAEMGYSESYVLHLLKQGRAAMRRHLDRTLCCPSG